MVSLAYYSRAHAHTLSRIFDTDLLAPDWQSAHRAQTRGMLTSFLCDVGHGLASPRRLGRARGAAGC